MIFEKNRVFKLLSLLVISVIAISLALFNRYPIVLADTGAYIATGFTGGALKERPSIYGVFVAHTGLKSTLWLPILFQGFIASYLIYRLIQLFNFKKAIFLTFVSVIVLTFMTGLSSFCSQIMPDVFTAFCFLSLSMLLFLENVTRNDKIIFSIIFLFSVLVHTSHIAIVIGVMFIFTIFYFLFSRNLEIKILPRNFRFAWFLSLLSILLVPVVQWLAVGEFKYPGGNGFIIARMAENGILEKYLKENCGPQNNYALCNYKDQISQNVTLFIWDPGSPFNQLGGFDNKSDEYSKIFKATLFKSEYLWLHIKDIIKGTFQQCFYHKIGDGIHIYYDGSGPHNNIAAFIPNEYKSYIAGDQMSGKLNFDEINIRQSWILTISYIIFILFFVKYDPKNVIDRKLLSACVLLIVFLILNAAVCASFSSVFYRYQARVIWLLPLMGLIIIFTKLYRPAYNE